MVCLQPQRFLDQLSFADKLKTHSSKLNVYFYIGNEVYNTHSCILRDIDHIILNDLPNNIIRKNSFYSFFTYTFNFLYRILSNSFSLFY